MSDTWRGIKALSDRGQAIIDKLNIEQPEETCLWTHTLDIETTCGANPHGDGLGFKYCPYCGNRLIRKAEDG